MPDELTKVLLIEEVASRDAVANALFASVTGDVPLVQALLDTHALTQEMLARYLARSEAPQIRQVAPLLDVVERLPPGLCARLLALPVRRDAITGTIDVAVVDALDPHPAREIAFHLGAPVRLLRASVAAIDEALHRLRTHAFPGLTRAAAPSDASSLNPGEERSSAGPFVRLDTSAPAVDADDERLYDSRPRVSAPAPPAPSVASFRGNTLPPADPALRVPGPRSLTDPASAAALRPSGVPVSQRQAHVLPGLASAQRRPSVTPPWGTEFHTPPSAPAPASASKSEPPRSGLGSEIPIPLTRRTFAAVSGGTQRPPPFVDPRNALGEGYAIDTANLRQIVEVTERSRIVDATASSSAATSAEPEGGPRTSRTASSAIADFTANHAASGNGRTSINPPAAVAFVLDAGSSFIPGPPPVPASPFNAFAAQVALSDIGGILAALRAAGSRDEVLELVLTGARMVAHRVGIFVVKRGGYLGWACTPEFGDRGSLQSILIPLESPSVFDEAVRDGIYLGPLRHDESHAALLHVMRGASRDVAVVPIRVSGKTAVVVLADELGDTMLATRRLEELARAAGDAFARIVRMRR